jgi:hypothetical protein
MTFDILVKTHPDLEQFTLTHQGHIGWAASRVHASNVVRRWHGLRQQCRVLA